MTGDEAMQYLIDGYNLLYALGVIHHGESSAELEHDRKRLLDLVLAFHGPCSDEVTVVFDARRAPPGIPAVQQYQGIRVLFAVRHPQADDLIEDLIQESASPHELVVVSNDRRILRAAKQHGCTVLSCGDYMDRLGRLGSSRRREEEAEPGKPLPRDKDENELWRQVFSGVESSPEMAELAEVPWSTEKRVF